MTEIDDISARLTMLETVVKQLITHMAVRDEDPAGWVRTRRTLALCAIDSTNPEQAARLYDATAALFDQAESVAGEYGDYGSAGTRHSFER
jgi:hypothetical protein